MEGKGKGCGLFYSPKLPHLKTNNLVANRRFGAGPMKIPALLFISQTYRTLNVPLGRGLIGSEEFIQRDRDESTYT